MVLQSRFQFKSGGKSLKEKTQEVNGGRQEDPRFLPFYNLKPGESPLRIVFVPIMLNEEDMTPVVTVGRHGGGRLGIANGIDRPDTICCNADTSNGLGNDCPICDVKFEQYSELKAAYEEGKITKEEWDQHKKEGPNRLNSTIDHIMACIVLKSPFELKKPSQDTDVYLIRVPQKAYASIEASINNGDVDENDIFTKVFELRCELNTYNKNDYTHSKFAYKGPSEDEEAVYNRLYDTGRVVPYKLNDILNDEKIVPKLLDSEEAYQEWLDAAELAIKKTLEKEANGDNKGEAKGGSKLNRDVSAKLNPQQNNQVEDDVPEQSAVTETVTHSEGEHKPEVDEKQPEPTVSVVEQQVTGSKPKADAPVGFDLASLRRRS